MIDPSETLLTGRWVSTETGVVGDDTCNRISSLLASYLVRITDSPDGWSTLYRDPDDGRLWQRTFPQGELHGGGPPQLECITKSQAKALYGVEA
ncbi:Imm27 family immunity protein [Lysobacter zhanggongensis]|uniref:Imm27 family immunity protein n=1 Tax=Lysobacter zhanggongensis TaxID=1774951 RepID=UPI00399C97B0